MKVLKQEQIDDNFVRLKNELSMSVQGKIESEKRRHALDERESGLVQREKKLQILIEQAFQKDKELREMIQQTSQSAQSRRKTNGPQN